MQLAEVDLGSSDSDQPMPYSKDSTVTVQYSLSQNSKLKTLKSRAKAWHRLAGHGVFIGTGMKMKMIIFDATL